MLFQLLKWGHLVALLGIICQQILKRRGHHFSAQILQSIVTPAGYMFLMPVILYQAKKYQGIWLEQRLDYCRLWFGIEVDFFFRWLISIVVQLQLTFWTKAGSYSKDEKALLDDDNIWNDKNTDDHLRWVKKETFDLSMQITYLIFLFGVGYLKDQHIDLFGPRQFMPAGLIILILLIQHAIHVMANIYMMVHGQ